MCFFLDDRLKNVSERTTSGTLQLLSYLVGVAGCKKVVFFQVSLWYNPALTGIFGPFCTEFLTD